jgi:hypothetical protein
MKPQVARPRWISQPASLCLALGLVANAPTLLALDFPGPEPDQAQARVEDGGLFVGNCALSVAWRLDDERLRPAEMRNVLTRQTVPLTGEVFQIVLADGTRYPATDLLPDGEPVVSELVTNARSSGLADRIPGRQLAVPLCSADGALGVHWRAQMRDRGNYVQQEIEITALEKDLAIREIIWFDQALPGATPAGTVDGSPMVAGNFFLGLEDPHAVISAGHSVRAIGSWTPADLEAGRARRKSWPLDAALLGTGKNEFVFQYQRGPHRLDIARAALMENGREVARDEHPGWSGRAGVKNVYSLPLARVDAKASYELVADIGTDSKLQLPAGRGVESFGEVSLRRHDGQASFCLRRNAPLREGETLTTSFVIGVAPKGQMRRAFLYYVERERAHPYRAFLHYNSWYDISPWHFPPEGWDPYAMNETNSLDAIRTCGERFIKPHRVVMDAMVFDEGWDDIDTLWGFHRGFPNGFKPHAALGREYGTSLGVWLSPLGGGVKAKEHRISFGSAHGYETNAAGFSMAGPKYYTAFKAVCLRMMREYGVNYFKFDGIARGTSEASTKTAGAGAAFMLDTDALRRLMLELREEDANLFINFTSGSWPSPFWLRYADSVWRQGRDTGALGKGPNQQRGLTYRDSGTYKNVVQRAPLFPLSSLMSGGITYSRHGRPSDPTYNSDGLKDDIRSYFGSGTGLQELYIQPSRFTTNDWSVLAEAAKWSRANQDVLADTHWIGGDPAKSQVYGWASWNPRKGIVTLRNPDMQTREFALDARTVFELPAGARTKFMLKSPWAEDAAKPELRAEAGKPLRLTLKPFEVLVFDAVPAR